MPMIKSAPLAAAREAMVVSADLKALHVAAVDAVPIGGEHTADSMLS